MAATSLSEIKANAFLTMGDMSAYNTAHYDKAVAEQMKTSSIDTAALADGASPSIDGRLIDVDFLFSNREDAEYVLDVQIRNNYYFSFLLNHFKASEITDWLKALPVMVTVDIKNLHSAYTKLFLRGRPMSDLVRATVVVERPEEAAVFFRELKALSGRGRFEYTYRDEQFNQRAQWRVVKIFIFPKGVTYKGHIMPVEVQVTTSRLHFLVKQSSWHRGYEVVRLNQFLKCKSVYEKHGHDVGEVLERLRARTGVDLTEEYERLSRGGDFVAAGGEFSVRPGADALSSGENGMTFRNFRGEENVHKLVNGMVYLKNSAYYWSEETFDLRGGASYRLEAHGKLGGGGGSADDECIILAVSPEPERHGTNDLNAWTVFVNLASVWVRSHMFGQQVGFFKEVRDADTPVKVEIFVRDGKVTGAVDGVPLESRGVRASPFPHRHFRVGILTWGMQHGTFLKSLQLSREGCEE